MHLDGLPVYDAKEPVIFTVTKRDIQRGGLQEPDSCAIAIACKRHEHSSDARIHIYHSYILHKDHWLRYRTPICVAREIIAFDRGGTFEPGEYQLLPPLPSQRLENKVVKPGRKSSVRKAKKLGFMHITKNVRSRPVFVRRIID